MATHHKVKPLVMLACPVFMAVERETYASHQALVYYCGRHMTNYDFCIGYIPWRMSVVRARDYIVRAALANDVDWILWLDDDQAVPADACKRLLDHGKPIVSALSFVRSEPYHAMIVNRDKPSDNGDYWIDDYPEGLIECDVTPFGCALTSTKVFHKTPEPWFWDQYDKYTEDVYFAQKAKEAGFKVYVDTTIKTTHYGERIAVDEEFAKAHWAKCKNRKVPEQSICPIPRELRGEFHTVKVDDEHS